MSIRILKAKGENRYIDQKWLIESIKELLDDHGKFPDDITMPVERFNEIRGVVYNDEELLPGPPPQGAPGQVSVGDIIRYCNDAAGKMRPDNEHRGVLLIAADALNQLVRRLDRYENPAIKQ